MHQLFFFSYVTLAHDCMLGPGPSRQLVPVGGTLANNEFNCCIAW